MHINELKETVVTKEVLKQVKCDGCKKLLHVVKVGDRSYFDRIRYYHVATHHNDWGNDSVDSWEYADYCFDCLEKALTEYYTNEEPDSGTAAFDIVAVYGYVPKIEEE